MLVAVALGAPFYIVFGALSDRVGRKPLIVGGCLLAALPYFPIFYGLSHYALRSRICRWSYADRRRAGMTMTFTREKLELPAGKGRLLLLLCCAPCSGEVMEAIQASGIEYAICASSGRPCMRTSTAST